jgi:protein-disulfide isomerase
MSNRFFVGVLILIAVIFGGVLLHDRKANPNTSDTSSNSQNATNHTEGSDKSGVVLIEYGDFQCPACGQYYPVVKELVDKYKDQITFQYRNFPLTQLHPNAFAAHRAAEAADKQGKFWEMHAKLYENQDQWSNASAGSVASFFESYATELGLDMNKFKQDVPSQEVNAKINADIKEGQKLGATGTPTFVLDGVKIDNPRSLEDFSKLIDDAIKKKATS